MDTSQLMLQAQQLQTKIEEAQKSLDNMTVKGMSKDGSVIITMTGKYDLISIDIQPELLSKDAKYVSDIIACAYCDAKTKADELIDKVMSNVTKM